MIILFNAWFESSSSVLVLRDNKETYPTGDAIEIFIDRNDTADIHDVSSADFINKFEKSGLVSPNIGFTKSSCWVKLTVRNKASKIGKWYLEVGVPWIHNIEIYLPDGKGSYTKEEYDYFSSEGNYLNPVFHLSLLYQEEKTFYLRVNSKSSILLPVFIHSSSNIAAKERNTQNFLAFYFGALLIMTFHSFFLFIRLKNRSYLYYVLFIFSLALGQLFSVYGIGFEYLPFLKHYRLLHMFNFISACFGLLFSRDLLDSKKFAPLHDIAILALAGVAVLAFVLCPLLGFRFSAKILIFLNFIPCIVVLSSAFISLYKKHTPAIYFIASTMFSIAGFILYNLMYSTSLIPYNTFIYFLPNLGIMVTAILLPIALADRFKIIEMEKRKTQQLMIENQKNSMENLRQINSAFRRFVPSKFLKLLGKEDIIEIKLGDQVQKEMTILFSDIRSFSTISEEMSPKETFEFINEFLKGISPIIRKNRGFIDKYIGDGIMALFPNKPTDAVTAAIQIQQYVLHFKSKLLKPDIHPIQVGIGIHTGSLTLGTIGDKYRMEGTVISDAVNLASRLESLSKKYHASIIASESTVKAIKPKYMFHFRFLGKEQVKGRFEYVNVYEILDCLPDNEKKKRIQNISKFEAGVNLYTKMNLESALDHFNQVLKLDPTDNVAQLFVSKIEEKTIGM